MSIQHVTQGLAVPDTTLDRMREGWLRKWASENTRHAYRFHLHQLEEWWASVDHTGRKVIEARADELAVFQAEFLVRERAYKASTVSSKMGAISSFFKHCAQHQVIAANPLTLVDTPSPPRGSTTRWLPWPEVERFLAAASEMGAQENAAGWLLVLGLRASEVGQVRLRDIERRGERRVLVVVGKGGRRREVPWPDQANRVAEQAAVGGKVVGWSDRRETAKLVTRLARAAGLEDPAGVTPHVLRHSFASHLWQETKDLIMVQQVLGHADVTTTRNYLHNAVDLAHHPVFEMADQMGSGR